MRAKRAPRCMLTAMDRIAFTIAFWALTVVVLVIAKRLDDRDRSHAAARARQVRRTLSTTGGASEN